MSDVNLELSHCDRNGAIIDSMSSEVDGRNAVKVMPPCHCLIPVRQGDLKVFLAVALKAWLHEVERTRPQYRVYVADEDSQGKPVDHPERSQSKTGQGQ